MVQWLTFEQKNPHHCKAPEALFPINGHQSNPWALPSSAVPQSEQKLFFAPTSTPANPSQQPKLPNFIHINHGFITKLTTEPLNHLHGFFPKSLQSKLCSLQFTSHRREPLKLQHHELPSLPLTTAPQAQATTATPL